MPTDTFPITANGNDDAGYRRGPSWATITSATFDPNPFGTGVVSISKTFNGGSSEFWVLNGWFRWDTSSLPDDAVVTAANLLVYVDGKDDPDGIEYAADFFDYGGNPPVAGDWEQTSSGDAISTISPGSLTAGIVNTVALTGLTGISLNGFTGMRLAPKTTTQPTADNFVDFASFESANQEARLEVTWNTPVAGASIAWIRA